MARIRSLSTTLRILPALVMVAFLTGAALQQAAPSHSPAKRDDAIKTLIVTGGHDYPPSFDSLFEGYDEIDARVNPHPNAFQNDFRKRTDVLVLYDMVSNMEPERKRNLRTFVESGKGVVILHHAICGHTDWPWWYEEVAGGRWFFEPTNGKPASTYQHDEHIKVRPVGTHPIIKDILPFTIFDETYKGLWISPKVKTLLETDHPLSDGKLAWISPYEKSRVVFIQLGHGREAHQNPEYRRLVKNAILWSAGRLNK
jgi:type 1 glutamine amidotransferase